MLEHESVVLGQQRRMILARLRALLHLPQNTALPEPPRELPMPEFPSTEQWLNARMQPKWRPPPGRYSLPTRLEQGTPRTTSGQTNHQRSPPKRGTVAASPTA